MNHTLIYGNMYDLFRILLLIIVYSVASLFGRMLIRSQAYSVASLGIER